jgi:DNA replication protein DnaC
LENKTTKDLKDFEPDHLQGLQCRFLEKAWQICHGFKIDSENSEICEIMFNYFTNITDPRIDHKKGILLMGSVGTGKTDLFMIWQALMKNFRIAESRLIVRDYLKDGIKGLEKWSFNYQVNQHGVTRPEPFVLCIDDFGLEKEEAGNFGNKADVISELVADRYNLFRNQGIKTHAISNLAEKLKDKYDERISDRFREMFNILKLTGKSRRK